MKGRRLLTFGAVLLQVAVLGALVTQQELMRAFGTRVELEVVGHDALDSLSGWYQDLDLAIARLPRSLCRDSEPVEPGDRVFVSLRASNGVHVVHTWSTREPSPESELYLRGTVVLSDAESVTVDYGLSRFYVPPGADDPALDRPRSLRLVVFVTADGRGLTDDLLVDGIPFEDWDRGH